MTKTLSNEDRFNFDEMLEGSITQSLIGALPIFEISPEEIGEERLKKYEEID